MKWSKNYEQNIFKINLFITFKSPRFFMYCIIYLSNSFPQFQQLADPLGVGVGEAVRTLQINYSPNFSCLPSLFTLMKCHDPRYDHSLSHSLNSFVSHLLHSPGKATALANSNSSSTSCVMGKKPQPYWLATMTVSSAPSDNYTILPEYFFFPHSKHQLPHPYTRWCLYFSLQWEYENLQPLAPHLPSICWHINRNTHVSM